MTPSVPTRSSSDIIDRGFEKGKVDLRDMRGKKHRVEPIKIEPTGKLNRLKLSNEKRIEVHEGERIRWTDSDKRDGRGMINATIASVEKVSAEGVTERKSTRLNSSH